MKKNILSIITASLLVSGFLTSNASASDVSALTKATVKLIKENRTITQDVLSIQSQQENVNSKIEQNKVLIKNIQDDNTKLNQNFNSVKDSINRNEALSKQNAQILTNLSSFKETSSNDIKALDFKINELGKKIGLSEASLNQLNNNSAKATNNSLSLKQDVDALKKEFEQYKLLNSGTVKNLSNQNNIDNSSIAQLNERLGKLEGENKVLKEELSNYKLFSDAEIKAVKTKLERTKPVYLMEEKEVQVNCKTGNCSNNSEADDVIKNFIK